MAADKSLNMVSSKIAMTDVEETNKHNTAELIRPDCTSFTILMNGQKDLNTHMEKFKKACVVYEKSLRKRSRRRYYNLGLMAKLEDTTTEDELKRLLKNGCRTFLIDITTQKPNDIERIVSSLNNTVQQCQNEDPNIQLVHSLAIQITGDCCRVCRLRNDCSVFLQKGDIMTLSTNIAYRYSGYKEIMYIINLKYYLNVLKLGDKISIGDEAKGVIVKKLKTNVAVLIENAGIVNSYNHIELPNQCYSLQFKNMSDIFQADLEFLLKINTDFIVMPSIRCLPFITLLYLTLKQYPELKVIGNIDLLYASKNKLNLMATIKMIDLLWISDFFTCSQNLHNYLCEKVIPVARALKKPIIGSVPLECCSDFKIFENHEFLYTIDCIFIEKSQWCHKYPLIVKKLMPIRNFHIGVVQNASEAIFVYSKCEMAMTSLARSEIYCPVYVIIPLDDVYSDNTKSGTLNCIRLVKSLNLRRNLKTILYKNAANIYDLQPIDFGIDYVRRLECIKTGDFVISIEVKKENGDESVQLGIGEDVVLLRAFYIPSPKEGDRYRC